MARAIEPARVRSRALTPEAAADSVRFAGNAGGFEPQRAGAWVNRCGRTLLADHDRAWGVRRGCQSAAAHAWRIDVAQALLLVLFLLVIDLAEIGSLVPQYASPDFAREFNITGSLRIPAATIYERLILGSWPLLADARHPRTASGPGP